MNKRFGPRVLTLFLALGLRFAFLDDAWAACNAIPAVPTAFDAATGAVDRPFARPGGEVKLTQEGPCAVEAAPFCVGDACNAQPERDLAVTLVFEPPNGPRNVVVLATDCAVLAGRVAACGTTPGVTSVSCRQVNGPEGSAPIGLEVLGSRSLRFRFPDTDDLLLPDGDDLQLTGPTSIAVSRPAQPLPCGLATGTCEEQRGLGLLACVDALFARDGECGNTAHPTFPSFTALPSPNDFQAICSTAGTTCTGARDEVRFTVDRDGNLLAPFDWRGVQPGDGLPIAGFVRFVTPLEAFPGSATPIAVPPDDALGGALAAFSPTGDLLDPRFEPKSGTTGMLDVFGTIDAPESVLRIARDARCTGGLRAGAPCGRDGDCPGASCGAGRFDFATRLLAGIGPVLLRRNTCVGGDAPLAGCTSAAPGVCLPAGQCGAFTADHLGATPLDSLFQTAMLEAALVPEGLDDRDLNADTDTLDEVLTLQDRATGTPLATSARPQAVGVAGVRLRVPPLFRPGVAVEGPVLAMLQSEYADGVGGAGDLNGDGDDVDAILRVFRVTPGPGVTDFTAGHAPMVVDASPMINGRSLAVSDGRVFVRVAEWGSVPARTERASVTTDGAQATGASFTPSLAADGTAVAFSSSAVDLVEGDNNECVRAGPVTDNCADVFVRDLVAGATSLVSVNAAGIPPDYDSTDPAIAGNARFVVFERDEDFGSGIYLHDRDADRDGILDERGPGEFATIALPTSYSASSPRMSFDGRWVIYDTRGFDDAGSTVVLFDRDADENGVFDEPGDDATRFVELGFENVGDVSADGRVAVFDGFGQIRLAQDATLVELDASGENPRVSADGRWVAFSSFDSGLVAGDTNDRNDVFLLDRVTQSIRRVSIDSAGRQADDHSDRAMAISGDGRYVAFSSTATNLVNGADPQCGKGTPTSCADVFVHDAITGTTTRVSVGPHGLPGHGDSGAPSLSANGLTVAFDSTADDLVAGDTNGGADVFVRRPDPTRLEHDLTGDGALDDVVLAVFDTRDARVTTLCPATAVAVDGASAAFLRPETSAASPGCPPVTTGGSLNGDTDATDTVVHRWSADGGVQNLGRAAVALAVEGGTIGALVSEAGDGVDYDGDGDLADTVAQVWDAANGWRNVAQAAGTIDVRGGYVAFLTSEGMAGADLNGDGDMMDVVVQAYELATSRTVSIGWAADDLVLGPTGLLAFRTPEAAQGEDLNGDGDLEDGVLLVYDLPTRRPLSTGQAALSCSANDRTCDPRIPYRVLGDTVRFITREADQGGRDLNDDGTIGIVKQMFNAAMMLTRPEGTPPDTARIAAAGVEPGALTVVGVVSGGVCTSTGDACFDDGDCPAGRCFLPPGGCLKNLGTCCDTTPNDDQYPCDGACDEDAFCVPTDVPGTGQCHARVGAAGCRDDAACLARDPGAFCADAGESTQRIAEPLGQGTGGGMVFSSAGQCTDPSGASLGLCSRDGDCPTGVVCSKRVIVATAADRDDDELPDPFDNCPDVPNVLQLDTDHDGVGDGCDAKPCDGVADGTPCSDLDPCSLDDRCAGGLCVPARACDDGLACNGVETCDAGIGCRAGTAVPADDGVACTVDACDEASLTPVHVADDARCDDGDRCNGVERCDPAVGCRSGTPPSCDDGDACTSDACDGTVGCRNEPRPPTAPDGVRCAVANVRAALGESGRPVCAGRCRRVVVKRLDAVDAALARAARVGSRRRCRQALDAARRRAEATAGRLARLDATEPLRVSARALAVRAATLSRSTYCEAAR